MYNHGMRMVSLASSSKGNCTYIESGDGKILIDAGVSVAHIEKCLSMLKVNPQEINGIIVSHEHEDHIRGVGALSKKYNIPIFCFVKLKDVLIAKCNGAGKNVREFTTDFSVNGLHIYPIEVPHDSTCCHGFVVNDGTASVAIVTDCGAMSDRIVDSLKGVPLVYLESNYDDELLMQSRYPYSTKMRIRSNRGHLSNMACAQTIEKLVSMGTRQVVLSHISENSNSPTIAYSTSKSYLMSKGIIEGVHVRIDIAKTMGPSTVFRL